MEDASHVRASGARYGHTNLIARDWHTVAEFYEQEVEAMVDALTSLLEPLLICVMGGAVGSMVIALYMPMFNIIKIIK